MDSAVKKHEYVYPKKNFEKDDVGVMRLFFDNGDYLSFRGGEIADMRLKLYDRLVAGERGFCTVAESGYIKLKVSRKDDIDYPDEFLYNSEEYRKDRKSYIEKRCVNEGGIKFIRLFDEDNRHDTIYGNIAAAMDGGFLVLTFSGIENFGSSDGDENVILLNDISKAKIVSINLDFENCEDFSVYFREIVDINLQFAHELEWDAGDLYRRVKSGFIKIRLDKMPDYRKVCFLGCKKSPGIKQLEKRLCWDKGICSHDICHLYIEYYYAGTGSRKVECVEVEDIRSDEEFELNERLEAEGGCEFEDFIGGYCKKCDDGTIMIAFGKNAEEILSD